MVSASLEALTSEPTNVLLRSPSGNSHSDAACTDLLTAHETGRTAHLLVTNADSTDERVRRWTSGMTDTPAALGVIAMGESTRSAAATGVQSPGSNWITVETIAHPGDLTGLGIEITELLDRWHGSGYRITVCFDSLSELLQHASIEKVYQFLHVLTQQLKSADAIAHYHLDSDAHDDETFYTLLSLFDAAVEVEADGSASIQTR